MPGIVREKYNNGKMSKDLSVEEIVKRIKRNRKTGKPIILSFGHTERIIRKAICNGTI